MDLEHLRANRTAGGGETAGGLREILQLSNAADVISFAGGFPDPATFPSAATLASLTEDVVSRGDGKALQYAPTPGLESVRDYLASRLEGLDGHRPAAEEVMVTSGAVEAIELICKRFVDPGDEIVVEAPTYLGAIMGFRAHGAHVVPVDVDDAGLRVDELEDLLRSGARPKLVYIIPDYQNPSGVSLDEQRRTALAELAEHYGFLILEDVAYRELYFEEPPPRSLWARNPGCTVQIGTFSKIFFPGVRLGWAAGPREAIDEMVTAKQNTDQCASALGQCLMEEYGRQGFLDSGLRSARRFYHDRCDRLVSALARTMPAEVTWERPQGGFFVWMACPPGTDAVDLARRARDHALAFVPGVPFFPDGRGKERIRLSFSRVDEERLEEGCERLGDLLRERALVSESDSKG